MKLIINFLYFEFLMQKILFKGIDKYKTDKEKFEFLGFEGVIKFV